MGLRDSSQDRGLGTPQSYWGTGGQECGVKDILTPTWQGTHLRVPLSEFGDPLAHPPKGTQPGSPPATSVSAGWDSLGFPLGGLPFSRGFSLLWTELGGSWGVSIPRAVHWGKLDESSVKPPFQRSSGYAVAWLCPGLSPQNEGSEETSRQPSPLTFSLLLVSPRHRLLVTVFLKAHSFGGQRLHGDTKGTRTLGAGCGGHRVSCEDVLGV